MEDGPNRLHVDSVTWFMALSGSTVSQNQINYTKSVWLRPAVTKFRLVSLVSAAHKHQLTAATTRLDFRLYFLLGHP